MMHPRSLRRIGTGSLLALATLFGCNSGESDAARTLDEADHALAALHADPSHPAPISVREDVYSDAIASLRSVESAGNDDQKKAAKAMLAKAHAGLGAIQSEEAARLRDSARDLIRSARLARERHVSRIQLADALAQYDPRAELQDLENELTSKHEQRGLARDEQALDFQRIEKIVTEADQHRASATGIRTREANLRIRALAAEGENRLDLVKQAVAEQRLADAQDVQAGGLDAKAANLKPNLEAIGRRIEMIDRQIDFIRLAQDEIRGRDQAGEEEAESSRGHAMDSANDLDGIIQELAALLRGPVEEVSSRSASAYGAALSATRAAAGSGRERSVSQLSIADQGIELAGLHSADVDIWDAFRTLTEELARTDSLPESGAYAALAAEASDKVREHGAAAVEAYDRAIAAIESSNSDELAEVMAKIQTLRESFGAAGGTADSPEAG